MKSDRVHCPFEIGGIEVRSGVSPTEAIVTYDVRVRNTIRIYLSLDLVCLWYLPWGVSVRALMIMLRCSSENGWFTILEATVYEEDISQN